MESVKRVPVANEVGSKKTKLRVPQTDLIYIGINPKKEKWSRDPRAELEVTRVRSGHGNLCTKQCNG